MRGAVFFSDSPILRFPDSRFSGRQSWMAVVSDVKLLIALCTEPGIEAKHRHEFVAESEAAKAQ
jgi:hypothetical protein